MSDSEAASEVALWYMRYMSPGYMICDDEEDAAGIGAAMTDDGGASVLGVQFQDGRTIAREEWPAYAEAEKRRRQEEESRAQRKPPPMRGIRDPFGGRALEVEVGEPGWLGVKP